MTTRTPGQRLGALYTASLWWLFGSLVLTLVGWGGLLAHVDDAGSGGGLLPGDRGAIVVWLAVAITGTVATAASAVAAVVAHVQVLSWRWHLSTNAAQPSPTE